MRLDGSQAEFRREDIDAYLASVVSDFIRHELLAGGVSFTFETVMSSVDKIEFLRKAQNQGYRTYLYFVATDDPEEGAAFTAARRLVGLALMQLGTFYLEDVTVPIPDLPELVDAAEPSKG